MAYTMDKAMVLETNPNGLENKLSDGFYKGSSSGAKNKSNRDFKNKLNYSSNEE